MLKRLTLFLILVLLIVPRYSIHADEVEEIQKQIDDLKRQRELSEAATTPLVSQLSDLETRISEINRRIAKLAESISQKENELKNLENELEKRNEELEFKKEIFTRTTQSFYVRSRLITPVSILLGGRDINQTIKQIGYYNALSDTDRKIILSISAEIKDLNNKSQQVVETKRLLESQKTSLASLRAQVNKEAEFYRQEIAKARAFQTQLTIEISKLTARQQQILAARSGQFIASVGDIELSDDYYASIRGFRESAPSGSFAVFSFGAYTHRKGMSQYGARGRAESGQNYKTILKEYYGREPVVKDTSGTINVSGFGALDFETTYLYGIAEMPSNWNLEALKAQAVAARTYAYRFKQSGQTICVTELCQVFSKLKSDNPPASWRLAVDSTRGEVLEDVVTYYSSTAGGYLTTSGWDTQDKTGGPNFIDKAYEKAGGSPWLYKAWYTKGYSPSSDKCGRLNPWLSSEELADIVNAALVLIKGSDEEKSRITPVTVSCWGGNPYSMSQLREVASKYGGISTVQTVAVEQGNGVTERVIINGIAFSGATFKQAFNLRAPGYLMIPQSGFVFFNIERK